MQKANAAAVEHVRVMETRLQQQKALVERMEVAGQDCSEQIERLNLLKLALEEMIIHCARLAPSPDEVQHAERMAPLEQRPRRNR